jgi:hypothetical protein
LGLPKAGLADVLVAYLHAMRCSEVVTLKADNVRDGFISIQRLKGSNATVQPLLSNDDGLFSEREALIDYARACYRNQFLFPITRQHFGDCLRNTHGKPESPHTSRIPMFSAYAGDACD